MGTRMDGTAIAQENVYPIRQTIEEPDEQQLSFVDRRLLDLNIKTMAITHKPYWNTTMVTAWVAVIVAIFTVLGAVGALYVYTRQVSIDEGIRIGEQREREKQIQERLKNAEEDLRRTKDLKLVQSGQQAGHEKEKH